jgi:hypothetical protein
MAPWRRYGREKIRSYTPPQNSLLAYEMLMMRYVYFAYYLVAKDRSRRRGLIAGQ